MYHRKSRKKYTIGRFFSDAASAACAVAVCSVVWVVDKVSDAC